MYESWTSTLLPVFTPSTLPWMLARVGPVGAASQQTARRRWSASGQARDDRRSALHIAAEVNVADAEPFARGQKLARTFVHGSVQRGR
jgi:hypothetical protein